MSTQVEIFGTQYTFEGGDPERVRQLADYVNRKMSETARSIKNVTSTRVAVLAAMNIVDEFFTLRDSVEHSNQTTAQRLDRLVALSKSMVSDPADETHDDSHQG
jgi:cell division protein ZapA